MKGEVVSSHSIKQFQGDLPENRENRFYISLIFYVHSLSAGALLCAVLKFTQFHLIDILLRGFKVLGFGVLSEYSLFFCVFLPLEIYSLGKIVGIYLFQSSLYCLHILMFVTESSLFSFILTSSQRALNWVYLWFKIFQPIFFQSHFCYTIWNLLFMDLCESESFSWWYTKHTLIIWEWKAWIYLSFRIFSSHPS